MEITRMVMQGLIGDIILRLGITFILMGVYMMLHSTIEIKTKLQIEIEKQLGFSID